MQVLELGYTKLLGIEASELPDYLLQMKPSAKLLNHLGTLHASASYSLAEISSGYLLRTVFDDIALDTLPILRSAIVKYKKATQGSIYSTAKLLGTNQRDVRSILKQKKRMLINIVVKLYTEDKQLIMSGEYEWFITMR